jgi:GNAT superfamily N-acetyltransferase
MRLDGEDMHGLIIEAQKQLSGSPSAWWIGPDSRIGAMEAIILQGGTVRGTVPVYAMKVADIPDLAVPEGLSIEEIVGQADITEWVECFSPSMGVAPSEVEKLKQTEINRRDDPGTYRRFAARVDGKIVGTSAMLEAEGVAGVYVCSTSSDHRRKGIAGLLTLKAAAAGADHGCEIATLQASKMGAPVYERIGFKKVAEYNLAAF